MIPLAIDARRRRFPQEASDRHAGSYVRSAVWDERTCAEIGKAGNEYWQRDIML